MPGAYNGFAKNYGVLGNPGAAKTSLVTILAFTVLLPLALLQVPDRYDSFLRIAPFVYAGIFALLASRLQGRDIEAHKDAGGHFTRPETP